MRNVTELTDGSDIVSANENGDLSYLTLHYEDGSSKDIKQAIVIGAQTEYTGDELDVTVLFTGLNREAIKFYIKTIIDVADRLGILQEIAEECRGNEQNKGETD